MKYIILILTALSFSQTSFSQNVKRFRIYSAKAMYYDYRGNEWVEDTAKIFHAKQQVIISVEGSDLIFSYGAKTIYKLNDISDDHKWDNKSWQLWKNATDEHGNPIVVFCFQNYVQKEFYIQICDPDLETGLQFDVIPL